MIKLFNKVGEKKDKKKPRDNEEPKAKKHRKEVPTVSDATKDKKSFVNARIAKIFDDGVVYYGTVKGFDGDFWSVKYDDSDSEDFELPDLQRGIRLFKEKAKRQK